MVWRKRTKKDYLALAQKRDFIFVDLYIPRTTTIKTTWQCKNGHIWMSTYSNIQTGYGCPYCSGKARKKEQDYHKLAKEYGYEWIGETLPKNTKTKTLWKCLSCENVSSKSYCKINSDIGCANCARKKQRKTKEDYNPNELNDILWVGQHLPKNVYEKTKWQCLLCENIFESNYVCIRYHKCGCQKCSNFVNGIKSSKQQDKIAQMINGIVNFKSGRFFIDVAIPDEMIAIEYDSWYWHARQQDSDKKRIEGLINFGWRVLVIKANKKIPSKKELLCKLDELSEKEYAEIICSDWGIGEYFKKRRGKC